MREIRVRAPGKLILSGEHAVVQQHPALGVALACYTDCQVKDHIPHTFRLVLSDLEQCYEGSWDTLSLSPTLAHYTLGFIARLWPEVQARGLQLSVHSQLPMGCGLGSSAALIVAMLQGVAQYLDRVLELAELWHLAREIEHFQHGRSSGLDVYLSQRGGQVYFVGQDQFHAQPPPRQLYVLHTGIPQDTTSACVQQTQAHFRADASLGQAFAEVTAAMYQAWMEADEIGLQQGMAANHRLLCRIGVVPPRVQACVQAIEALGGSAKLCGAGAITGEQAGMLWVEGLTDIESLAKRFAYPWRRFALDGQGVVCASL